MKSNAFCLLTAATLASCLYVSAQDKNLVLGSAVTVAYEKLGAVRGSAGIIGDNYYVLENDYGGRMDMNNNIRTSVSIVSIRTGQLVKRFSLNEMVAQNKSEVNKILLCDVITWKGQLIGFYTHKKAPRASFTAQALLLDPQGNPTKTGVEVTSFDPGNSPFQGALLSGRGKLSIVNDFQFRFTPDSAKMLVLGSAPKDKKGNVSFRIFRPGLELEREVTAAVPLDAKTADLVEFAMDKSGMIYLLTRTKTVKKEEGEFNFQLYTIDTDKNNEVKSLSLKVPGKYLRNANIGLTANGVPIVAGFYNSGLRKKVYDEIHGAYTIRINKDNWAAPVVHTRDLPEAAMLTAVEEKDLRKGAGFPVQLAIYKFLPNGKGLYAFGRSDVISVTQRGTTGAMNTYREVSRYPISYAIDESGALLWEGLHPVSVSNTELFTRTGRVEYMAGREETVGFYMGKPGEKDVLSLWTVVASSSGVTRKPVIPYTGGWELIVENTVFSISPNEYVALVYGAGNGKVNDFFRLVRFTY